ncbi:hypothetical protein L596_016692 [Steinernema carpocapsae]|nr:hypothetical protein L596_016692 [Steinernema carpocapsae]
MRVPEMQVSQAIQVTQQQQKNDGETKLESKEKGQNTSMEPTQETQVFKTPTTQEKSDAKDKKSKNKRSAADPKKPQKTDASNASQKNSGEDTGDHSANHRSYSFDCYPDHADGREHPEKGGHADDRAYAQGRRRQREESAPG